MASPYHDALSPEARGALVDTLLVRQSGRCFICDQTLEPAEDSDALRVDVVQPLSSGGADEPTNLAALHAGCSDSRQHADLGIARALALFGRDRSAHNDGSIAAPPSVVASAAPQSPTRAGQVSATQVPAAQAPASQPPAASQPRPGAVRVVRTAEPAPASGPGASSFGRALAVIAVGAALPGAGFLAMGRRRLGLVVLGVAVAAVAVVALVVMRGDPKSTAVEVASRPQWLLLGGIGVLVVAALWVAVIVIGHRMAVPRSATSAQRWTAAGLTAVLSLAVLLPAVVVARYAFATKGLLDTVFAATPVSGDTPLTSAPIDRADPWKNTPRLNVLLIGGDSERVAAGGEGLLTTTMIIASVDTATGDSKLVSLPHVLQNAPIPSDNPLSSLYPDGYTCSPDPSACLLNGVYREAEAHADLFPDVTDPGLATVRDVVTEVTGVPLDYHLFVDLEGFASLVDALGGVDLDVGPLPVPVIGASTGDTIPAGRQHLDGAQAVAFARERPGSPAATATTERVSRQSAVLGALLDAADPAAVVTHYLVLSTAAQDTLSTDVPIELLPALVDLAELVRGQPLDVVPLPSDAVTPADPDYGQIRAAVTAALGTAAGSTG